MELHSPLCDLLGIKVPVVLAAMRDMSTPELAGAISRAGGLGVLQKQYDPPDLFRVRVKATKQLADGHPFGVGFLLPFPLQELLTIALEEGASLIWFYWGDPSPFVQKVHAAGAKVAHQVGSVEAAKRAAAAGVDIIIAQGIEAGGHVEGTTSALVLVPCIVDAVFPTPVLAAGGIADGRGLVAALALGAQGVVIGTRFVATVESGAHDFYRKKLLSASEEDTVVTQMYSALWKNAPHRVLLTEVVREHKDRVPSKDQGPVIAERVVGDEKVAVKQFMGYPPVPSTTGDMERMVMFAGQCVGLVNEVLPAEKVLQNIVNEAVSLIKERLLVCVGGHSQAIAGALESADLLEG